MPNLKRNLEKLRRDQRHLRPSKPKTRDEDWRDLLQSAVHAINPTLFCQDALQFTPDPWQNALLGTQARKVLVNIARQSGKSTTAAAKALHRAIFFPKSLVLLVAPALQQANELRRKIDDHRRSLKGLQIEAVEDNKRTLEFANESRIIIVAADQDTVRSYSAVSMIIEDESAIVPDAVYETMQPMLAVSKGQHILLSTPNGFRGHFAELWHHGKTLSEDGEGWEKYEYTAWNNPRISHKWLKEQKEEKERMGRGWWFMQEYECSFIAAAQGLVYPYSPNQNLADAREVQPLSPQGRLEGWQFVLGIDYGMNDSTAFVVVGWRRHDATVYVIESYEERGMLPSAAGEKALQFTKKYPFARMVGDAGGLGKPYVEEARRRFRLPLEAAEKNNKRGYIEIMAGELRSGHIKVLPGNEGLVEEWSRLPWDEEREEPAEGHKDHLADACLYAYRAAMHYVEEARKVLPAPGTVEAFRLEADEMREAHIRNATSSGRDWWDSEDPRWLPQNDDLSLN